MQSVYAIDETLEFYRRLLEVERARLALVEDDAVAGDAECEASLAVARQRRVVDGIQREIATLEDLFAVRSA